MPRYTAHDISGDTFPGDDIEACLNCNTRFTEGAFCYHCGQRRDTRRLSLRNFVKYDLHKGIWFLKPSLFVMIKKVLLRPGVMAKEYIRGRRQPLDGYISLLVVLSGLFLLVYSWQDQLIFHSARTEPANLQLRRLFHFYQGYGDWLDLMLIPFLAIVGAICFRRLRYNITEHIYLNGIFLGGAAVIAILCMGLQVLVFMAGWKCSFMIPAMLLYFLYSYWQTYRPYYSTGGFIWRFCAMILLLSSLILLTGVLIFVVLITTAP